MPWSTKGQTLILILCVGSGIEWAKRTASLISRIYRFNFLVDLARHILLGKVGILNLLALEKESYQKDSRKPMVEDGSLEDDQCRDFYHQCYGHLFKQGSLWRICGPV